MCRLESGGPGVSPGSTTYPLPRRRFPANGHCFLRLSSVSLALGCGRALSAQHRVPSPIKTLALTRHPPDPGLLKRWGEGKGGERRGGEG